MVKALAEHKPYLAAQLQSKARPITVQPGHLTLHIEPSGLKEPREIAAELKAALNQMDEQPWQVHLAEDARGVETIIEQKKRTKNQMLDQARTSPELKQVMQAFPNAKVVDILTDDNEE